MNILAEDIWERIISKNFNSWGKNVKWWLLGTEKRFGRLVVEFDDCRELAFTIYIHNRQQLETEIQKAIDTHSEINYKRLQRLDEISSRRGYY